MTRQAMTLRLGTRGSPLALAQARESATRLAAAGLGPVDAFPPVVIRTSGDMLRDRALSEAGGKGLFTKELDAALLDGTIDLAVHSAKDMPTFLPEELAILGYLPREDARDCFIGGAAARIADLPAGARVGSASLRRKALLLARRPDLEVALLRGNVQRRLDQVRRGAFAGTMLALAGLRRLGLADVATEICDIAEFPPAPGQGAIALVGRADDGRAREAARAIADAATGLALACERAFLAGLDGSCRSALAGHATVSGGRLSFRGMALREDGSEVFDIAREGEAREAGEAAEIGASAARDLLARLPPGIVGA